MSNGDGGGGFDPKLFAILALQGISNPKGGALAQNTLLQQFMRREQIQQQMQQLKDAQNETDTLVKVEMANAVQQQAQGDPSQQASNLLTGAVQGGYANANVPTQQTRQQLGTLATENRAQRAHIAEEDRVVKRNEKLEAQQLAKDQRRFRTTGHTIGLRGQDLIDFSSLMTDPFPNETARQVAMQQRFPGLGKTELDRINEDKARSQLEESRIRLRTLKLDYEKAIQDEQAAAVMAQRLGQVSDRYAGPNGTGVYATDMARLDRTLKAVPQETDEFTLPLAARRAGVPVHEMIGAAIPLGTTPLGEQLQRHLEASLASGRSMETWLGEMNQQGVFNNLAMMRLEARDEYRPEDEIEKGSPEEAALSRAYEQELRAIEQAARNYLIDNGSNILQPALPGPFGIKSPQTQQAQPAQPTEQPTAGTSTPESETGVVAPTAEEVKELRVERDRVTKEIATLRNQIVRFQRMQTQAGGQSMKSNLAELQTEIKEKQAEVAAITERIAEFIRGNRSISNIQIDPLAIQR